MKKLVSPANAVEFVSSVKKAANKDLCKAVKLMQGNPDNKVKVQRIKQELGRRGYYK